MIGTLISIFVAVISWVVAYREHKRAKQAEELLKTLKRNIETGHDEIKILLLKKIHEDIPAEVKQEIIETYIEDNWDDLVDEVIQAQADDYMANNMY